MDGGHMILTRANPEPVGPVLFRTVRLPPVLRGEARPKSSQGP